MQVNAARAARKLVAAAILVCASLYASAAAKFVQGNSAFNQNTINTSLSVPFSTNTTPGNLIVAYVVPGTNSPGAISVADTAGNVYHEAAATITNGQCTMSQEFFYAENIVGGPDTVTAETSNVGGMVLVILEYSGLAIHNALDGQAPSLYSWCPWSETPSSAGFATSNPHDLIVTAGVLSGTEPVWSAEANATLRTDPSLGFAVEDEEVVARGNYAPALNLTSPANWLAAAVAFRAYNDAGLLCGKVDDAAAYLPPNWDTFTAPAEGQSYVDPVFGCVVTRITDSSIDETLYNGTRPSFLTYYSTFTPMNATDTMLLVASNDGGWRVRDLNGDVVVARTNMPRMNNGHPVWDATNGQVFYFTYSNTLYSGTISGNSVAVMPLHTFGEYSGIVSPDSADLSQDGDHIALVGQNPDNTLDVFVWSLSQQTKTSVYTTTCTTSESVTATPQPGCVHKLQLTADNLLAIEFAYDGAGAEQGLQLWNGSLLKHLQDYTNHADFGRDLNGNPVYLESGNSSTLPDITNPCPSGWGLDVRQQNTLKSAVCLLDHQPPWHVSYRGSRSQPWSALSFFDDRTPPGPEFFNSDVNFQEPSTANWLRYEDEIVVAKVDGTNVYRLAHARSRSMEDYGSQPHAAISRDGHYVIFSSNMAFPNGCPADMLVATQCSDVYVIEIR